MLHVMVMATEVGGHFVFHKHRVQLLNQNISWTVVAYRPDYVCVCMCTWLCMCTLSLSLSLSLSLRLSLCTCV